MNNLFKCITSISCMVVQLRTPRNLGNGHCLDDLNELIFIIYKIQDSLSVILQSVHSKMDVNTTQF